MKVFTKLLNNEKLSSDLIVKQVNGKAKPVDFFQYSTSEQFTGEYWIDGKKIYCKTIYANATGVNAKISHNVSNIGSYKCIDYSNTFINGGTQSFMPIQVYDSNSLSNFFSFHNITDKEITFRTGTGWLGPWNIYITIRYTKTTD